MLGNAVSMWEMGWEPVTHPKHLTPSQNCLDSSKLAFLRGYSQGPRPLEHQCSPSLSVFHSSHPKGGCQHGLWMCFGNFPPWPCSHSLFGAQLADLAL